MEIKRLNQTGFNIDWDELQYNCWDVFDDPKSLTESEILLANFFMEIMKIDVEDEYIIAFKAAPVHFAYLAVNFIRRLKTEFPENFTGNFEASIEVNL